MSVDAALKVQELCDIIAEYLDFKWDLRACTLVSPVFTSSGQRQLFHDIIFNRGTLDFDDVSILEGYDEAKACNRLCAVLETSPHILPYIRRVRASLEPSVLKPLAKFQLPNLHDVVLHRRRGGPAAEESITLAAQLIGSPTVYRVGLISPIFTNMHQMARLFGKHTPALKSVFLYYVTFKKTILESEVEPHAPLPRVRVKTLRWGTRYNVASEWILDPLFPLDFSALVRLDLDNGVQFGLIMHRVVDRTRRSLTRLAIDAQQVVNPNYTSDPQTALLASLPALTDLTLFTTGHEPADVATILAGLSPKSGLRKLTLQVKKVRQLKTEQMRTLGLACVESLPHECAVTVHLRRFASGADGVDQVGLTCEAFAELDASGRLRIVV
ncbi:hypothetical protein C8F04DRAFT_744449 [Mycena alexandri]|uniref:Uncharacterized protein n=1 Tax=Mycena alexandri TaxID=1745969 RepID=A0AAD6SLB3_9AGAR|nr:hypothetical protein C8F04DRAFT_744449 [Mycena alexandri]